MKDGFKTHTKNDIEFIPKYRINENYKETNKFDIVDGFPMNKKINYNQSKMIKAIKNGMIILMSYAGDKDKWKGGRERVIQPMVLGVNKNTGNELVRGWHLEGYSVSEKSETKKVWRLFKTVNIKSMLFTGHFYRLPPKGYKMNDRVMTEKTIVQADFNTIRRNQDKLIKMNKIERSDDIKLNKKGFGVIKIKISNTNTDLDLMQPFNNPLLKNIKNKKSIRITILKTIFSNEYIAILNVLGEKGKTIKVYDNKTLLGSYKVIISYTGDNLKQKRKVNGISTFKLYQYIKKI